MEVPVVKTNEKLREGAHDQLNKTHDQHSITWIKFGAYSPTSLVNVDISDGIWPVKPLLERYLLQQKNLKM